MERHSLPDKPSPAIRDHARTVGEAVVAAVPVAGGPALVLLNGLVQSSHQKRLDAWLEQLGEVVRELESRTEFLSGDGESSELFVSAVGRATQIALGTHIEEKLDLLKHGLVNVGCNRENDDFLALRYLGFIEELAPEHVKLLSYAVAPAVWHPEWKRTDSATPRALIDRADLPVRRELVDLLLADLLARCLIVADDLVIAAQGPMAVRPFSTTLGEGFVAFVRAM